MKDPTGDKQFNAAPMKSEKKKKQRDLKHFSKSEEASAPFEGDICSLHGRCNKPAQTLREVLPSHGVCLTV